MDFNASLRRAIKTGNVILGQNNTEKCIKEGKAQMVVVAANCPENFKNHLAGMRTSSSTHLRVRASHSARHAASPLW